MKKILILISVLGLVYACNYGTYADSLKAEKKLISNFITRQQIHVINNEPQRDQWGEKDYLKVDGYDDFYFHLVNGGDTEGDTVKVNDVVIVRYIKYTLDAVADTADYLTTLTEPHPTEIKFGSVSENSCTAWHVAIQKMRYSGAECKIICPSKLGFTADNTSVTPYGYDIKIVIKKY